MKQEKQFSSPSPQTSQKGNIYIFVFFGIVGVFSALSLFHMNTSSELKQASPPAPPHKISQSIIRPNAVGTLSSQYPGDQYRCENMNFETNDAGEKEVKNPYLLTSIVDGRYSPDAAIGEFFENMDSEFEQRIARLEGKTIGCDLSEIDTPSSFHDKKLESQAEFETRLHEEYRQIDCALFEILESDMLLCYPGEGLVTAVELLQCDRSFRTRELETVREDLATALDITLLQSSEMMMVWPLHKRLECLNEEIALQREWLSAFYDIFKRLPAAYMNASQP